MTKDELAKAKNLIDEYNHLLVMANNKASEIQEYLEAVTEDSELAFDLMCNMQDTLDESSRCKVCLNSFKYNFYCLEKQNKEGMMI